MKGTARLTADREKNQTIYNELKTCKKNQSENLIIVDLLRNDLTGIARNHTVNVDKLFSIEKYSSLLQITSQISAKVDSDVSFRKILDNLFPCGSITGAPKISTQEIIKNIEQSNRRVYTGSIGYILPNNDMCFNVAIRTLEKTNDTIKLGVGGGITVYSEYQSEWEEMNTKISFIKQLYKPDFSLVESVYFNGQFRNLDLHLERLENSARKLFFVIDINEVCNKLIEYTEHLLANKEYKIRLEYQYNQDVTIEHIEINSNNKQRILLQICPEKINSKNQLFNHKTTHNSSRGFYTKMHNKHIGNQENRELLFVNEFGNITETRFHNIVVEIDDNKYTPLLSDGVLDGIARKAMIAEKGVVAKSIDLVELSLADNIYLINSVRGLIPAYLERVK